MQVTTERLENCIVKLTIEVDESRTNAYLRRAARALSRQYRLPGFRPGKAPYDVVVQRLGIESVRAQVVEQFGDEVFEQGLEESELEPVDQASLDQVTWDPFALHVTVPVGPDVDLGAYQEIRIPWQAPEVSDEDLEDALARLQRQQAERQASERPAELGDQIVADITSKVDDETVLDNTGREIVLDADSPYPVPGFAEAVVGMEVDETREFTLTYPEDHYNKDIAGQEGHFTVHVSEIQTEVLPELDDEFAMSVGDYEDLDDLKAKLRQSLQEEAENAAEQAFEEELWQALIETAEIEYPEVYVDRETEVMQNRFAGQLRSQGMDIDSFFQLTNTTAENWRADIRPQAIEQMKRRLILSEVVKEQEIEVNDDEIQAEIEKTLESMGDQADEMRALLESENGRLSVEDSLLREKATEYLKSVVRVEAEAGENQPGESTAEAKDADEEASERVAAEPAEASETEQEIVTGGETVEITPSELHVEPEAPSEGQSDKELEPEVESEEDANIEAADEQVLLETAQEIEQETAAEPEQEPVAGDSASAEE